MVHLGGRTDGSLSSPKSPFLSKYILDSAILVKVSSVGYARAPEFDLEAHNQPSMDERIEYALQNETKFLEALEEEERMMVISKEKDGRKMWMPVRQSMGKRIWRGLERLMARM